MNINGKPAKFLVDTGASVSLIDMKQEKKYHFSSYENLGSGVMNSFSGLNKLMLTSRIEVKHNQNTFKGFKFYAANIDYLHRFLEKRSIHILGIVGADFLLKNKAIIDYQNRKLILNI